MRNLAVLSTPWPPVLLNEPQENICLLQRSQHWSSTPLHSSREVEDVPVLHTKLLPGDAGLAVENFSAPTFFATAADGAMSHTALSNRAETWLVKALFALPFSLQLPHLAARDRWKLCRDTGIQEHIWVLIFYLVTLERAKHNLQNRETVIKKLTFTLVFQLTWLRLHQVVPVLGCS